MFRPGSCKYRGCMYRSLPGIESGIRVGVLTFGEAVHFYRVAEHPSKEGNASVHEHARTAFSSDSFGELAFYLFLPLVTVRDVCCLL